jgi:hypothetical protein
MASTAAAARTMMARRYRPRPRVWLRLGCLGCSLPLLAIVAALAVLVALLA